MKKIKNLLLILYAPVFVLLISWILSMNKEFNWLGVIIFAGVVTGTAILLYIKKSEKMIAAVSGWMFSGALYAFVAAEGMCGAYTGVFEFLALVIFAFTYFFVCLPEVIRPQQKRKRSLKK